MTLIEEIEAFIKTRSEAKALGEKTITALKELTAALVESGGAEIVLVEADTGNRIGQVYMSEPNYSQMKKAAAASDQTVEEFMIAAIRAGLAAEDASGT